MNDDDSSDLTLPEALRQVRQRIVDMQTMRGYMIARGVGDAAIEDVDRWLAEELDKERALMAQGAR